jgi:hypothetical protein
VAKVAAQGVAKVAAQRVATVPCPMASRQPRLRQNQGAGSALAPNLHEQLDIGPQPDSCTHLKSARLT